MAKKRYIIPALAIAAVSGALIFGASYASAEGEGTTLVDRLASKFNLNKEEVQTVFEEHRQEREEYRDQHRAEELQSKVDDGTITAEQKAKIEAKLTEIDAERDKLREELRAQNLTRDQIREKMQAFHEEMEKWASENGIDLDKVMPLGEKRGGSGGFGIGGHGFGEGR